LSDLNIEKSYQIITSFELEITENTDSFTSLNVKSEVYKDILTFNFIEDIVYSLNGDSLIKLVDIFKNFNNDNFIIINKEINTINIKYHKKVNLIFIKIFDKITRKLNENFN
jgi:hypothetical protein